MDYNYLLAVYLLMLFFQTLYVFEEVRNEAYKEVGSLSTYLVATSALMLVYFLPPMLILLGALWGIYVAFLPTPLSIGNGVGHLFRLIKDKSLRSNLVLGLFLGFSLAITGILTFLTLLLNL